MKKSIFDELNNIKADADIFLDALKTIPEKDSEKLEFISKNFKPSEKLPNPFDTLKPASSTDASLKYENDDFANLAKPAKKNSGGGILDAMDFSDSFRNLFLALLKTDGLSLQEIKENPIFAEDDTLVMMLRTLVRQGNLERFEDNNIVKYRAVAGKREGRKVSSDIWDALD